MNPTVEISERGKEILVYDGAKFTFSKVLKSKETFWRCSVKSCKSKVWTIVDAKTDLVVSRSELDHNHVSDPKVLNRQLISNRAKKKAEEHVSEKPSKIIKSVLEDRAEKIETLSNKDITYIRNNIYYKRMKAQSNSPKSSEETIQILENLEYRAFNGEKLVSTVDLEKEILILSCDTNLRQLCTHDTIYLYNFGLNQFSHIISIHILVKGKCNPYVHCFLPDNSASSYKDTFEHVKKRCYDINEDFKPKFVMLQDFENSINVALELVWPDTIISRGGFKVPPSLL